MTKPSADNPSGQPLGLPLNDLLGPLVVGRAYPATAAAPLAPSPCTIVEIGAGERMYTRAELDAAVAAERERCARAARDAIHSVPAEMRFSADIMIHATDAAIGWPNAGGNRRA